jgi:uncharacterized repeat protein (TIGR04076 family)
VKVTVLRRFNMNEVFKDPPIKIRYSGPCDAFEEGQEFILGAEKTLSMPEGFCSFAWDTLFPWIMITRSGGDIEFYEDRGVAVVSCPDGLRPVIFKLERM